MEIVQGPGRHLKGDKCPGGHWRPGDRVQVISGPIWADSIGTIVSASGLHGLRVALDGKGPWHGLGWEVREAPCLAAAGPARHGEEGAGAEERDVVEL